MTYLPLPGWYRDPWGSPSLRWWTGLNWAGYLAPLPPPPIPPLDVTVETLKREDPQPWGWRPVAIPLIAYVLLIVGGQVLARTIAPSRGTGEVVFDVLANLAIQGCLVLAVYAAGREIAERNGGWGRTFGFRGIRGADWLPALAGFGISLGARIAVGFIVVLIFGPDVAREARNIPTSDNPSVIGAVMLLLLAVFFAPVVEELVFRGLLLRTFLRRMRFWPAAILSTTIFALGHTYEVGTVEGATLLALSVSMVGIVNCELNRRTDRLGPGMLAHGMANLLAIVIILAGVAGS